MNPEEVKSPARWVEPAELARDLRASIVADHDPAHLDPESPEDHARLARWARPYGWFEADVRASSEEPDPRPRIPDEEVAAWIGQEVSPHPHRWQETTAAVGELEKRYLKAQADRLESCGTVWWKKHVLRIFWKDRRGRERLRRQVGIHRCKHAWCPTCGRSRQAKLTAEIERLLVLTKDFGLHEGHARLVTLTVPNGPDVEELKRMAHVGFAKLQRTRWWNRNAFGWVRGSEVVTGEDGDWNLHIHLLAIFWSPRVSYQKLGEVWTRELGGPREGDKNYVVDLETLEKKRWVRKDGKSGDLTRKGSLVRAARYITKYITKAEELAKLKSGPGGLAHLFSATRGLRRFAVGGGCSVLRRAAGVLLPGSAFQAEEAIAGTYLHEGRAPWRVEEMDPETGEIRDVPPERLADERTRAMKTWGTILETNPVPRERQALPGHVVGVPAGPKGRYRRIGPMPLAGGHPRVQDFERAEAKAERWVNFTLALTTTLMTVLNPEPERRVRKGLTAAMRIWFRRSWKKHRRTMGLQLEGARALIAGNDWSVYRWEETTKKGKTLRFAAVLPRVRYAWRPVRQAILGQLAHGSDEWTLRRRQAAKAGAEILLDPLARRDHIHAIKAALDDRVGLGDGDTRHTVTRRGLKAAELWETYLHEMSTSPTAVWDEGTQAIRNRALSLERPGLLEVEPPATRQLRRDLESTF